MNERERWIVYPLLFFALGAALRDKFLQRMTTDEVIAKRILCDELSVRDPAKEDRLVAKLYSQAPNTPQAPDANRFGVLALFDSEGRELCGVTNDALYVRQVNCEGVRIFDPTSPTRVLAGLGSVTVADEDGKPRPFGILMLNNEDFGAVTGNPPRGVVLPGGRPGAEAQPDGSATPEAEQDPETEQDDDEAENPGDADAAGVPRNGERPAPKAA